MISDFPKKSWAGGKIEKVVALCVEFLVDLGKRLPDSSIELGIVKFAAHIENTLDHPIAKLGINGAGGKLIQIITHDLLVLFTAVIIAANAENREIRRKQFAFHKVINGREELARGEVAGAAKNNHDTRACGRWRT